MNKWSDKPGPQGAQKFQFNQVFGDGMQWRYAHGDQQGYQRGVQETLAGVQKACADQIRVEFERLVDLQEKMIRMVHRSVAELVLHVAESLMPALMKKGALTEVQDLVEGVFDSLNVSELTIVVPEVLVLPLKDHLKDVLEISSEDSLNEKSQENQDNPFNQEQKKEKVILHIRQARPDELLNASDCRLEWVGGGLERREERLKQEVHKALERLLGASALEGETSDEDNKKEETNQEKISEKM